MTIENVLWMLTALAGVVVLLTRMRLSAARHAGHAQVSRAVVDAHTVVGVLALGTWAAYLSSPSTTLGYVALGLWWVEVLIGIGILLRWLPGGGRHAAEATEDGWAQGPALSILGHVGLLLGVAFFTWTVLADKVA